MTQPENKGKRWKQDEVSEMLSLIKDGESKEDIAEQLKRTPYSIQCQLCSVASKMVTDGQTMEDVVEITSLTEEVIEKYMAMNEKAKKKKQESKVKKKDKKEDKMSDNDRIVELLTEIRDLLQKANK